MVLRGETGSLEACIEGRENTDGDTVSRRVRFKGSNAFRTIVDRYLELYERRLHQFEDVYYNGVLIAGRSELKSEFLNNKTGRANDKTA